MENTEKYRGTTSELDSEAIQKLYYEYQMTNQEIADMTWSTKANVNKVLIHGIKHYTYRIFFFTRQNLSNNI